MWEYVKLALFIIMPITISVFAGTYSYCNYLFGKYGKSEEYYDKYIERPNTKKKKIWEPNLSYEEREESKKIKIQEQCLMHRRLKSKTETEYYYPNDRPRRKRFDFFMFLSKMNCIITIILVLSIIIFVLFDIFPYNILKNIILIKAIIVDGFCILCCIPFGFLITIIFNLIFNVGKVTNFWKE